jgi:HD-GYP domain-containing protein (c-di-GMP phosphodiesterase class II)
MPVDEALEELRRCSGTQFDPDVVERFINIVGKTASDVQLQERA